MKKPPVGRVTLQHVADEANCSVALVSAVLSRRQGNMRVADETRQRIEESARRLKYQPNFAASSLARKNTRIIGFFVRPTPVSDHFGPYEGAILNGIDASCRKNGYYLLVSNMYSRNGLEECAEHIKSGLIDGALLMLPSNFADLDYWKDDLHGRVVGIGGGLGKGSIPTVRFDNRSAVGMAVEHLIGLGHRRICFLYNQETLEHHDNRQRMDAFLEVIKQERLKTWVIPWSMFVDISVGDEDRNWQAMDPLLELPSNSQPTAYIGINDYVAGKALHRLLHRFQKRIPSECSVIGLGGSLISHYTYPPLSSVTMPYLQIGQTATLELLRQLGISKIEGELDSQDASLYARSGHDIVFNPRLFLQMSTAKPLSPGSSAPVQGEA